MNPDIPFIDWAALEADLLAPFAYDMQHTPQSPRWHAEGDVFTHTMMTVDALLSMPGYIALPPRQQLELRLAALLHDIGKTVCTDLSQPHLPAPSHAHVGAHMARTSLWQRFALCGEPTLQLIRETVCLLVGFHGMPPNVINNPDNIFRVHCAASCGVLVPDFNISLLCLLAEADMLGRYTTGPDDAMLRIALCRELARDEGCLDAPYTFADAHTRHAFLQGREVWKDQKLYDDTWGEVVLLCGLPGTGKDTFIANHYPDLPTVSLDNIRAKLRIKPTDNQGYVAHAAKEQAKAFLREHQPFVWNSTNLTRQRKTLIDLFEQYGARTRIVYLETSLDEQHRRNTQRKAAVPQQVLDSMLSRLLPPHTFEATAVEWHCV